MKTSNLSDMLVQELNLEDENIVNGGGFLSYTGNLIVGALLAELLFEGAKKCCSDFVAGYNSSY